MGINIWGLRSQSVDTKCNLARGVEKERAEVSKYISLKFINKPEKENNRWSNEQKQGWNQHQVNGKAVKTLKKKEQR